MKLGVIGVGTISSAVIEGFLRAGLVNKNIYQVLLSPRNSQKAKDLLQLYASHNLNGNMQIMKSNQEVLNGSEVVLVGVHHNSLGDIFHELQFSSRHTIISITAVITQEQLYEFTKKEVPIEKIFRVCTLPAAKFLKATSIMFPPNKEISSLLQPLGHILECDTEEKYKAAMVPHCLMGDFYNRCKVMKDWLVEKGISEQQASPYIANIMQTMISDALSRPEDASVFEDLISEQTPGGLNEKLLGILKEKGSYKNFLDTMNEL